MKLHEERKGQRGKGTRHKAGGRRGYEGGGTRDDGQDWQGLDKFVVVWGAGLCRIGGGH